MTPMCEGPLSVRQCALALHRHSRERNMGCKKWWVAMVYCHGWWVATVYCHSALLWYVCYHGGLPWCIAMGGGLLRCIAIVHYYGTYVTMVGCYGVLPWCIAMVGCYSVLHTPTQHTHITYYQTIPAYCYIYRGQYKQSIVPFVHLKLALISLCCKTVKPPKRTSAT